MARIGRFGFVAIAVLFHVTYIVSIFDVYFVSPIVHGMQSFGVPRPDGRRPPAQRVVLFVGDGLRADMAFQSFPDPSPDDPTDPRALEPRPLMPFVRSRVEKHGTFGISHTRVPTESRPGHVALIAGLYEDVSAVMTGWKLNPVNFDSVFNRSRHTWSWGSPDILPMFKTGAVPGRVDADHYDADFEDFTDDATKLDAWVFEKVEAMFKNARTNSTLATQLRQDKNVFFLHLLGIDTTGHFFRPFSKEYLHNIKIVDKGVEKMTRIIDDFFGDDQTAYVFTADHGMSEYGSHGDGHPDNTRTPLVVWGAGVKKPVIVKGRIAPGHEDGFSLDWGFDHIARHDVAQADVAALMAYLAGLDFPTNSVGQLPLDFIAADVEEQAEATLANAQGILEMYRVKEDKKREVEFNFQPFGDFVSDDSTIESRVAAVRQLIEQQRYGEAIEQSHALQQLGIDGLRYLQTYDWLFLRILVTLGYLGWIAFALTTVIDLHVLSGKTKESRTTASTGGFVAIFVGLIATLISKRSPFTYYLYVPFPVVFWEEVFARRNSLVAGRKALFGYVKSNKDVIVLLIKGLASIAFLEALVISYFRREIYTISYIAAIFWPLSYGNDFIGANKVLLLIWAIACGSMSIFTLLDALQVESVNLVSFGGFLMFSIGILYLVYESRLISSEPDDNGYGPVQPPLPSDASSSDPTTISKITTPGTTATATKTTSDAAAAKTAAVGSRTNAWSRLVIGLQTGLILLAIVVTKSSIESLQAKRGLPIGNQIVGWMTFLASLGVPFLHSMHPQTHHTHRLIVLFLTFSPTFIILTISWEGLFYLAFCMTLVIWVRLEHHIHTFAVAAEPAPSLAPTVPKSSARQMLADAANQLKSADEGAGPRAQYRPLALTDLRVALFFFFFLQSAFFSVGNIASVSAFSLDSVLRLIPIFDPFSQGAILIFKLMVPYIFMSANLGILNRRIGVAPSSLFMLVMATCDVLTLNFFWLVRDEGSWLDIGTSISHFFIASLLSAFVAVIEVVSELFVSGVEVDQGVGRAKAPQSNGKVPARGSPDGGASLRNRPAQSGS